MPTLVDYLIIGGKAVFIWSFALFLLPVLIWFERKGAAFIQDRAGPNRAAVFGIRLAGFIHNIADVVKLLMKEMMIPPQVNRAYFMIAPVLGFTFILTAFAVIPWADNFLVAGRNISMQVADLNCGILYILAITSLNVYGIVLAGWSSNNKFALMGGLRSTAQSTAVKTSRIHPTGASSSSSFFRFRSMMVKMMSTMMAPAYTSTCRMNTNSALSIANSPASAHRERISENAPESGFFWLTMSNPPATARNARM